MERRKLSQEEVESLLEGLKGWKFDDDMIKKDIKFDNFIDALAFVNKVGEIAEAIDHHPDIKFGWGYAEISTTTHDRGGVTDVDVHLAFKVDALG